MRHDPATTAAAKLDVLLAVSDGWTKSGAAKMAGVHRWTLYRWRRDDPEFSERFDKTWKEAAELRAYYLWKKHPFRGLRPPTGKGTRAKPRFSMR